MDAKKIYEQLFYLDRSLMGSANDKALELIGAEIPLRIYSFRSGDKVFDWQIPKEWIFHSGHMVDQDTGKTLLNAADNILRVVNYSEKFHGTVEYKQLVKHLHYSHVMPNAIPYLTSYYAKNWGLCMPQKQFHQLNKKHTYKVEIDVERKSGVMNIGEAVIKGKSDKEVVYSSYLCHPRQAHDGLSGVVMMLLLFHLLRDSNNYYTYRFLFIPETIGSIALLSRNIIRPSRVEYALVVTCVGRGEHINYKKTFLANHTIDRVVERVLKKKGRKYTVRTFWPQGSDERQFSSPSIRIPTGSIMGNVYQEYPEYHTSADNLNYVSLPAVKKFAQLYYQVAKEYEQYPKLINNLPGGEPFLTKYGLYRVLGVPGHTSQETIRSWILFLADGSHTIVDMAAETGFTERELKPFVAQLLKMKLIKETE
ncbi:MAG: DUF4910 domain-containing protein [bacterium]|nr:DUF4910 domain-containing protein [bacterium]